MGLFDLFRTKKTPLIEPTVPSISATARITSQIPADVVELLWFFDGDRKNIGRNTEEPSGISEQFPLDPKTEPEKLGYWPNYSEMSAAQRYSYLCWLCDIDAETDIGNVFTFFYGLERFITTPKVTQAVKMIDRLKLHHENASFMHYSNAALVYASLLTKDSEALTKIKTDGHDASLLLLSKAAMTKQLSAHEIMENSNQFGWTNLRYIKQYPDLFLENLKTGLLSLFDNDFYLIPDNVGDVPTKEISLSNVSLETKTTVNFQELDDVIIKSTLSSHFPRIITIPDFAKSEPIRFDLYQLLRAAHEKTKSDVAKLRSSGKLPDRNSSTTKEPRINKTTGYPMAKESAIQRAREQYQQIIALPKHTPTGNREYDYQTQVVEEVLPHYHLGDLYYKQGEWNKAEEEWLSILPKMAVIPAEKLAILYHKQHRYSDEINVLLDGKKYGEHNAVYPSDNNPNFEERILKAQKFLESHRSSDVSTKTAVTVSDPTVELRKYKSLLDDGIITQDEFNAKKKQLLGL